jgi:transposase
MSMGFKKPSRSMDFADFAMANCLEQNRSIKLMEQVSNTINWSRVESILLSHYTVGTSEEGARAYLPLMLFKCLLLQKWFRIQSDPELENQINDRLSCKTFLGLAFSQPAPDHSTFSRFRGRLRKAAMDAINSEILRQFEQQGLSINEGVAVDARVRDPAQQGHLQNRYTVEQYFGISHLHDRANRARFTTIVKNKFNTWCRQAAFNVTRGMKILSRRAA